MNFKVLIPVIFIFIALNVQASVTESTSYLTFYDEPKTLSFIVENDSGQMQNLNIKVFSPVGYEINGNKNILENGEKTLIEITFLPNNKVLNSSYQGTILIELGREKTQKTISMNFYEKVSGEEETQEENKTKENPVLEGIALTGNFVFAGFNALLEPINIALILIAAVLLLLFVSRLVKRLNEGKK